MKLVSPGDQRPLSIERVSFGNDWSGKILIPASGDGVSISVPLEIPALPALVEWQSYAERLTGDPSSLPGYRALKYSSDGEMFRARFVASQATIDVVCKRVGRHRPTRRLAAGLARSRLARNFHGAMELLGAGINTALPLAWIARRSGGGEEWLVSQFVPDLVDLDLVALQLMARLEPARRRRTKDAIIDRVVDLLDALEKHRLVHRDLKASNILLQNWDGQREPVRLWIVDLDGLRHQRFWDRGRRHRALVRLGASLASYSAATRTDFCRAFKRAQPEPRPLGSGHNPTRRFSPVASDRPTSRTVSVGDDWKRDYRRLVLAAQAYNRHARRRKTHKLDADFGDG